MNIRIGLCSLGCKVNQYETDTYAAAFRQKGATVLPFDEACDVYIINTCTVTALSDRKSRQLLRRAKSLNPSALVVATGCYAQVSPQDVEAMEEVDLIIGTSGRDKIAETVLSALEHGAKNTVGDIFERREYEEISTDGQESRTRAYIKIQDGCDNYCSYCIVPYARGHVRSRPIENILAEAHKLAQNGFREIVLAGISVASYGKDLIAISLIDVIEAVCSVRGIERVRLSSIDPRAFTGSFITRLAAQEKVCRHFHISLQSGCDSVLKRMNRRYTASEYLNVLAALRDTMDGVMITTDIICGFPGETEAEFAQTLEFVKKACFLKAHVFPYSERQGTAAAKMEQLQRGVRTERARILSEVCEALRAETERAAVGRTEKVLFEDGGEGLSGSYLRILVPSASELSGEIRTVKITKYINSRLMGELI
ncbi:MAG: tRNA (N(6)-L-threonylcarbamoyladenosine(37)-C(2))-methylthiotransferase MtaB [Clostridia bacterium]|nr:tRNA (N(6)-L-threonylcarbamoyladenosine(37)-C(2))-methylthiotransferase MtaB [Clostridia bacterium]